MKLGKGVNELSFCRPDTPHRNRNNVPDHLRAMPVKLFVLIFYEEYHFVESQFDFTCSLINRINNLGIQNHQVKL